MKRISREELQEIYFLNHFRDLDRKLNTLNLFRLQMSFGKTYSIFIKEELVNCFDESVPSGSFKIVSAMCFSLSYNVKSSLLPMRLLTGFLWRFLSISCIEFPIT